MAQDRTEKGKANFVNALQNSLGNVSLACKSTDISRRTYYNWLKEDKEFEMTCDEVKEKNLDFAESQLLKHIKDGDKICLIFFLKTQGKQRGYVERMETDEIGNREPIEVTIVNPLHEVKGND